MMFFMWMAALAAAVDSSQPLKPEPSLGSRIAQPLEQFDVKEARATSWEFADCAVKLHGSIAEAFVLDGGRLNYDKTDLKAFDGKCMQNVAERKLADVSLQMQSDIARFALANALARRGLSAFDPNLLRQAGPLQYPVLNHADYTPRAGRKYKPKELEALAAQMPRDQARIAFYRFGECVARTDPVNSRLLVFASPESADESLAVKALMPSFGACLTQGHQFKTNRTMMKGTIALAYYRLAKAPRLPPIPQGTAK